MKQQNKTTTTTTRILPEQHYDKRTIRTLVACWNAIQNMPILNINKRIQLT